MKFNGSLKMWCEAGYSVLKSITSIVGSTTLNIKQLYWEYVNPSLYDPCNECVILFLGIGWIYIQKRRTKIRRENSGQVQQKSEQEPQVQSSQRESQTKEVIINF